MQDQGLKPLDWTALVLYHRRQQEGSAEDGSLALALAGIKSDGAEWSSVARTHSSEQPPVNLSSALCPCRPNLEIHMDIERTMELVQRGSAQSSG